MSRVSPSSALPGDFGFPSALRLLPPGDPALLARLRLLSFDFTTGELQETRRLKSPGFAREKFISEKRNFQINIAYILPLMLFTIMLFTT
jgi:hypothetical protein